MSEHDMKNNDLSFMFNIFNRWNVYYQTENGEEGNFEILEVHIFVGEKAIFVFVARGETDGNRWEAYRQRGIDKTEWYDIDDMGIISCHTKMVSSVVENHLKKAAAEYKKWNNEKKKWVFVQEE